MWRIINCRRRTAFNYRKVKSFVTLKCDIRIQRLDVGYLHARLLIDEQRNIWLEQLDESKSTFLNGKKMEGPVLLKDHDLFVISNREFRFELLRDTQQMAFFNSTPLQFPEEFYDCSLVRRRSSLKTPLKKIFEEVLAGTLFYHDKQNV
ncbi:uncharacterized protein LOC135120322 isoform X2 [Zophobas morio]|uniref:uncharacterized protein LOC135120322 isoform X2 n=1 Tax=Zophobas morio TaxID=2755281 RepID=UPI003082D92B